VPTVSWEADLDEASFETPWRCGWGLLFRRFLLVALLRRGLVAFGGSASHGALQVLWISIRWSIGSWLLQRKNGTILLGSSEGQAAEQAQNLVTSLGGVAVHAV
jgi:hypothetical protein